MCGNHGSYGISILLVLIASTSLADDDTQLKGIYREFFRSPVKVENIRKLYPENIIHVGRADTPLLRGKQRFMETNILALAQMVNSGQIELSGKA